MGLQDQTRPHLSLHWRPDGFAAPSQGVASRGRRRKRRVLGAKTVIKGLLPQSPRGDDRGSGFVTNWVSYLPDYPRIN
jgi:hypothetical protein